MARVPARSDLERREIADVVELQPARVVVGMLPAGKFLYAADMGGPGNIVLYGVVKLLAYAAWCWFALRLAGCAGLLARAAAMGLVRWLIGLVLGVFLFFALPTTRDQVLAQYIAVYVPVRALEWLVIGAWLLPPGASWSASRRPLWVAGGITLSFITDLVSPEMIEHGRFCVGRCLC